ncbi:MAG: hypothetical protein GX100_06935 [candidate division WS1 bacterium]|nr:hypothetical protein [candidate division WS1 bacterium]
MQATGVRTTRGPRHWRGAQVPPPAYAREDRSRPVGPPPGPEVVLRWHDPQRGERVRGRTLAVVAGLMLPGLGLPLANGLMMWGWWGTLQGMWLTVVTITGAFAILLLVIRDVWLHRAYVAYEDERGQAITQEAHGQRWVYAYRLGEDVPRWIPLEQWTFVPRRQVERQMESALTNLAIAGASLWVASRLWRWSSRSVRRWW